MKNSTLKIIGIAVISSMALISGQILAIPVALVASGVILFTKEKTPHERLVMQCRSTFKMNYADAEYYARNLEAICSEEYKKAFNERTIDRED